MGMKSNSSRNLELVTWEGLFCFANILAVGFIKVELLDLMKFLALVIIFPETSWLQNPDPANGEAPLYKNLPK